MSDRGWKSSLNEYEKFVNSKSYDSEYLRRIGLHKNVIELIEKSSGGNLLDVGCGDGWIYKHLKENRKDFNYFSCDVAEPIDKEFVKAGQFTIQDIRSLQYPDRQFDLVVASLVLIWFSEIEMAVRELCRVLKTDGRIIVALVSPYFYRTGYVDSENNFKVTRDLSKDFIIENHKISGVIGSFKYYYRPMYKYINLFIKNGVQLENIFDWFIDIQKYREEVLMKKESKIKRTEKVPLYTFLEFRKS
ncbi:class I SAM-dependent methyltransferase [Oscillatoriales cyanobacterium LEGE 11467]|uniref:Class I SAM-dependent methyltransferase n=1 Tax=Zarconia navalis LEGE 11467 TaxID=1828826 RepID=A0A928Z865_9CYAN|nr:class I SAM-dependent methyltransferase [Zarconia navalis]MBE9042142.1 class I SAM-dependent methyltransferase [Zarconia navalis LEGE 11467]